MKKNYFLMMIAAAAIAVAGCNKNADDEPDVYEADDAPPYAASKKVWKIGNLTWSDAIHMPDCDHEGFEMSTRTPQCRSYYAGPTTWFYYNWSYIDKYPLYLCPDPWRVPDKKDLLVISDNKNHIDLIEEWGLSGVATAKTVVGHFEVGYIASKSVFTAVEGELMWILGWSVGAFGEDVDVEVYDGSRTTGRPVRCVR
jgi:hypothetical protein